MQRQFNGKTVKEDTHIIGSIPILCTRKLTGSQLHIACEKYRNWWQPERRQQPLRQFGETPIKLTSVKTAKGAAIKNLN